MSSFSFISNKVLENNLETTFDHIVELLGLSESAFYKNKITLVSSFRKTVIIYTASIIEALLLWKLKQKIKAKEVEVDNEWKYIDVKILHKITDSEEIVGAKRKKETKQIDRIDLLRIIDLCVKHKIIKEQFAKDVHKVRELRNRLHIGGLGELEKRYTHKDLSFVFDVAKKTKSICAQRT